MVRIHVVSDVHGENESLARAGAGADLFVCLGDLILFLDYDDPGRGALADLLGPEVTAEYMRLRTAKEFDRARAHLDRSWELRGVPDVDRFPMILDRIREQYSRVFAAMPQGALLTYGNVDLPHLWPEYLRPGHRVLDGETIESHGLTLGFLGSGLRTVYRTPNEISDEDFAAKVARLGRCDVVFSHVPPALPEITYDVVARRFERGSLALADYIRMFQPRYVFHGHVHQPLRARQRMGRTEIINVGHFKNVRQPHIATL